MTDNHKNHYAFPGGIEAKDVTQHLNGNGAQIANYAIRSCRIDGNTKGDIDDRIEDMRKIQTTAGFELDRLQEEKDTRSEKITVDTYVMSELGDWVKVGKMKDEGVNVVEDFKINIKYPKVKLLAYTETSSDFDDLGLMDFDFDSEPVEDLIEFAGRSCYESYGKKNPATANNVDYIRETVFNKGHQSILEHATATFYLTGVSRSFLAELSRHRFISLSVLSQRFVKAKEANVVLPPALLDDYYHNKEVRKSIDDSIRAAWKTYKTLESELAERYKEESKRAREAARAVLPNMAETRIVVTANFREWLTIIDRRTAPDADAEMMKVISIIQSELKRLAPNVFDNL